MPYHIPIGFHNVQLGYSRALDPEPMITAFGLEDVGLGPAVAAEVAIAIDAVGSIHDQTPSTVVLSFIRVQSGSLSGAPPYLTFELPLNDAGDAAGLSLVPQNTAILVKKVTAIAGRQGRGRMFWPVVAESFTDNIGNVDAAVLSDLQTAWDTFYDELAAASTNVVLFHTAGEVIQDPTPITSFVVDSRVATQRRRLR